jgi:hypothetical protein
MVLNRHEGIQKGFVLGLTLHLLCITKVCKIGTMGSVADPRCLSRILIFSDPGSRVKMIPDPDTVLHR